jgi:hypothetical protein
LDITSFFESFLDRALHAVVTPNIFTTTPDRGVRAGAFVKDGYKFIELPQQRPPVPGRRYTFIDAESFTNFLLRSPDFTPEDTEIAGDNGALVAINQVLHERHQVVLKLANDDAWTHWRSVNGSTFTVPELRQLLKERRNDLVDKSLSASLQGVAVSISSGADVKIDAKTGLVTYAGQQKNVEVSGAVPDHFVLAIPVYVGQPAQKVEVDIVPKINSKAEDPAERLSLTLKIVDPATVIRLAWEERVGKVRELLGPEWLVGLGSIDFERA